MKCIDFQIVKKNAPWHFQVSLHIDICTKKKKKWKFDVVLSQIFLFYYYYLKYVRRSLAIDIVNVMLCMPYGTSFFYHIFLLWFNLNTSIFE